MEDLRFLFSAVGHPTSPGIVSTLKNNGERNIKIIGIDSDRTRIISKIFDNFYQVPKFSDKKFISKILEICKKEMIDVYWTRREEEAFLTCDNEEKFNKLGVKLIRPASKKILEIACNKNKFHNLFEKNKIIHARYHQIKNFKDFTNSLTLLKNLNDKIVLKPSESSGGRGALIINFNQKYNLEKKSGELLEYSPDAVTTMLAKITPKKFPELIAMEYLTGKYYSVDVLSKNGKILYLVPKLRIVGTPSNTIVGKINSNKNVEKIVSKVCKLFKFSYLQNYELIVNEKNQPMIYDINPRGGASIAFCNAGGINLLYLSIKMALDEKIPTNFKIKNDLKMIKAHHEYYE